MIFKQVYFVDVKKAAISSRQQPWLESFYAFRQRPLNIDRTTNAIFRGAKRKIDDGHLSSFAFKFLFAIQLRATVIAGSLHLRWIAAIRASLCNPNFRQQFRKPPNRS